MGKQIDITGQVFGRLTALRPTEKRDRNKNVVWVCQCECGELTEVGAGHLRRGSTKSCGCLQSPDLTGQVFGRLTAIRPTEKRSRNGDIKWLCQCSCEPGRFVEIAAISLRNGNTKSCGCLQREAVAETGKASVVMGTRISNIRNSETTLRKDNKTGVKGVSYEEKNRRWAAHLGFQGHGFKIWRKSFEEAVETRRKMKAVHEEFLEWWDGLSPEERAGAAASYENDKQAQYVLLKERIDNLK